jgi:hypothetical protein
MNTYLRPLISLLLISILLPGCEDPSAPEIRASFDEINRLFDTREGEKAVALLAPPSIRQYDQWLPYARSATRDQIAALPAVDRAEILMMRHRLTRSELETLDGRAYLILGTNRGWFATDSNSADIQLGRIRVRDTTASAEIIDDGERSNATYNFELIDGVWRLDWVGIDALFNEWVAEAAAEYGVTEDEILVSQEEMDSGANVREDIWDR